MRKKQVIIAFVLSVFAASIAQAQEPYQLRGTWHMSFSGVPFAKLWVAVDEKPETYDFTAAFKSSGVVRLFKKMKSLTKSHGVRTENGWQPLVLDYENKDEGKKTKLTYDASGQLVARDVAPEDDPNYRPTVSFEEASQAQSVGSILFAFRDTFKAMDKQPGTSFTLPLYDGKRLADITVQYVGKLNVPIDGKPIPTYQLALSRKLVNGYTLKEIKRYQEGDPPVHLFVRQSDYFPVAMDVTLALGTIRAEWRPE